MDEKYLRSISVDWNQIDRNSYVRGIPSIRGLTDLEFHQNITFFSGENGTGKSTLLEAIAVAYGFNPEGGTRNFNFSTKETHSGLFQGIRMVKGVRMPRHSFFLRAESFYNVSTMAEEYRDGDDPRVYYRKYGGKSPHEQSHGECFLGLMQNSFNERGFYILDEPEAALSPQRQLTLFCYLSRLAKGGAQFLIASHSPILMGIPDAEILNFNGDGIHRIAYEETESYQVTEMFINSREYLMRRLMED